MLQMIIDITNAATAGRYIYNVSLDFIGLSTGVHTWQWHLNCTGRSQQLACQSRCIHLRCFSIMLICNYITCVTYMSANIGFQQTLDPDLNLSS